MNTKASKQLAYTLRHDSAMSDEHGWVLVPAVLKTLKISSSVLREIVERDTKGRYEFSADSQRVRAVQGHSYPVNLEWVTVSPSDVLYHGTATRFLDSIMSEGLIKGSRQWVHLSDDVETATTVGSRHGKVVVLQVAAGSMVDAGHEFYRSANGVWMVEHVPAEFLTIL